MHAHVSLELALVFFKRYGMHACLSKNERTGNGARHMWRKVEWSHA